MADGSEPAKPLNAQICPGTTLILYVEDDIVNQQVLDMMLSTHPEYRVLLACDQQEVEEVLGEEPYLPDVVLMDNQLLNCTGIEVIEWMRQRYTKDIVFVMCTARSQLEAAELATTAHAEGYLCKPYTTKDLLGLLCTVKVSHGSPHAGSKAPAVTAPAPVAESTTFRSCTQRSPPGQSAYVSKLYNSTATRGNLMRNAARSQSSQSALLSSLGATSSSNVSVAAGVPPTAAAPRPASAAQARGVAVEQSADEPSLRSNYDPCGVRGQCAAAMHTNTGNGADLWHADGHLPFANLHWHRDAGGHRLHPSEVALPVTLTGAPGVAESRVKPKRSIVDEHVSGSETRDLQTSASGPLMPVHRSSIDAVEAPPDTVAPVIMHGMAQGDARGRDIPALRQVALLPHEHGRSFDTCLRSERDASTSRSWSALAMAGRPAPPDDMCSSSCSNVAIGSWPQLVPSNHVSAAMAAPSDWATGDTRHHEASVSAPASSSEVLRGSPHDAETYAGQSAVTSEAHSRSIESAQILAKDCSGEAGGSCVSGPGELQSMNSLLRSSNGVVPMGMRRSHRRRISACVTDSVHVRSSRHVPPSRPVPVLIPASCGRNTLPRNSTLATGMDEARASDGWGPVWVRLSPVGKADGSRGCTVVLADALQTARTDLEEPRQVHVGVADSLETLLSEFLSLGITDDPKDAADIAAAVQRTVHVLNLPAACSAGSDENECGQSPDDEGVLLDDLLQVLGIPAARQALLSKGLTLSQLNRMSALQLMQEGVVLLPELEALMDALYSL